MTRSWKVLLLLSLVIAYAAGAFAQSATKATIRGKITNAQGNSVPNAEINAVETATGFVHTVNARADGSYNLGGLTPGLLNIVVAAPGYEPKSQDLTVLVGQTLDLNIRLTPTAVLSESITVVGTQAVETKTSEIATNVTTQQIESLPQDDRNFLNFAALAPGIRLSKDPQRKTFAGDAQDAEQTNIFIDGVSTKNDVLQGGTSGQDSSRGNPFPQNAVQEFRVISQNFSAQYDHASSAIITAITKSGGNQFKGQAFVFYQPKRWVAKTEKGFQFSTLTTNESYRRTQPGISFGGPIIRDQLNFFLAYEGDDEHATRPVVVTVQPERFASQFSQFTGTFSSPFRSNLAFGKLSWQYAKNQLVDFSGSYRREHETRDFGGAESFEHATDVRNWVYGATARHQWNSSSALNEATLSWQKYGWNPTPLNPNTPSLRFFAPGFATVFVRGGNTTTQKFDQRRLELRDNYNFAPWTMQGVHNFQVGGNIDFMKYRVNKSLLGNPEFKFLPDETGKFGNVPFEADFGFGNPILALNNNEYGIYGQDNWSVNNHLTLNLGLRWDYESRMLDEDYVTPANIVAALKGKTFQFDGRTISIPDEYFSTGSERKPYKNEWQPRFGFSYDLRGDSRSVVFGGWGRYYDRLFLNSTLDERFRLQFPVFRFNFSPEGRPGTIKWDPAFFSAEGLRALVAQGAARPEIFLLSNNTKPPFSNQYNIGFRQAFGMWLASASYNVVRGKRGITYVAASGTCCGAFAPGFGAVILNDPVGKSFWYEGESITIDRPYTSQTRWGARFLYTHAKAEQNGNDLFSLDAPSASAYARHPIPGSEPNHFNATGIFGLPFDFRFSTNVTLGSGPATPVFDFSKGFSLQGRLATGVINRAVYPPKSSGFGFRNVDFRLEKDFNFGRTGIGIVAEIFNAFNFTNFGCLESFVPPEGNPNLGRPNCVVSLGRREQIGLKLNF
jgi:outer membrane receptor protein involved in Fe transport